MRAAAIASLLAIGTSVLAGSPAEDARWTVNVCVRKNMSDPRLNLLRTESIASQIFAEAGVQIRWRSGDPRRIERQVPIIIDLFSNTPETLAPGNLAYAQAYEGVHIRIFWDRVQNTVDAHPSLATFLLAHVMAHEVVHILECTDRHSKTGLMKARWTPIEIEEMGVHPFSLTSEDVQLIHVGLIKRTTH